MAIFNNSTMSIIIKENTVGFRDEDENFHFTNTIGKMPTTEYINQIKPHGEESVDNIKQLKSQISNDMIIERQTLYENTNKNYQNILTNIPTDYTTLYNESQKLKDVTNILYNNNNLLPLTTSGWSANEVSKFNDVTVNEIFNGFCVCPTSNTSSYIYVDIPSGNISTLDCFSMSVLAGVSKGIGGILIQGSYQENGVTIYDEIYSSSIISLREDSSINGNEPTNIEIDLNNKDVLKYYTIRLTIKILGPINTDFTFYKMFLGSKKEKYSPLLDIIESIKEQ